jgi:hypothetical protein
MQWPTKVSIYNEEPSYNWIWSSTFAWKCDLGILSREGNVTRSETMAQQEQLGIACL